MIMEVILAKLNQVEAKLDRLMDMISKQSNVNVPSIPNLDVPQAEDIRKQVSDRIAQARQRIDKYK